MFTRRLINFLNTVDEKTSILYKLIKNFPKDYQYQSSGWYHSLSEQISSFKSRLIMTAIIVASLIPVLFTIDDLISGNRVHWVNYGIPFAILISLMIAFLNFKNIRFVSYGVLLTGLSGFLVCLFLPNTRSVYVIIFFVYPFLATLLFGHRVAIIWHFILILMGGILISLSFSGILPALTVSLTGRDFSVFLSTYLVISLIAHFIDKQIQAYLSSIIHEELYDSTSGFPNRSMLENTIPANNDSFFVLAQIMHQNELRSFWGRSAINKNVCDLMKFLTVSKDFVIKPFRFNEYEIGCLVSFQGDISYGDKCLQQVSERFSSFMFNFDGYSIKPDIRLGAASLESHEDWDSSLQISRAFLALQLAIARNLRFYAYRLEDCTVESPPAVAIEFNFLRRVLEKKWYQVLFQPIYDVLDGSILYHEALFRVFDDSNVIKSIYPFLKTAETSGLDEMITDIVLNRAIDMIRKTESRVSINITYSDIHRGKLFEILKSPDLEEVRSKLVLELLEVSDLKIESPECHDFITRISSLGVQIAIDDFGAGYANLNYLVGLPISIIKVDGYLITSLIEDPKRKELIAGLVSFCSKTGKTVIAEWVETEELRDILLDMGIRYMQGYLLGQPQDNVIHYTGEFTVAGHQK